MGKKPPGMRHWTEYLVAFGVFLLPLSLVWIGGRLAGAKSEAKVHVERATSPEKDRKVEQKEADLRKEVAKEDKELARARVQAERAEVLSEFLPALSSEHAATRQLALEALSLALPEDAPVLVETVYESDPDPRVRERARGLLMNVLESLANELYSSKKERRAAARDALSRRWDDSPMVIEALAATMEDKTVEGKRATDASVAEGHHEVLLVLNRLSSEVLLRAKDRVVGILESEKRRGDKRAQVLVQSIQTKLDKN